MNEAAALGREKNDPGVVFAYWGARTNGECAATARGSARLSQNGRRSSETMGDAPTHAPTCCWRKPIAPGYTNRIKHCHTSIAQRPASSHYEELPICAYPRRCERFEIDSTRGDFKQAIYYLARYNSLKDSVYNLLKAEQIARVQTIYENEFKERENQQLRIERTLKDEELRSKEGLLTVISIGLFIVGILAWILFRQRRQILKVNKKLQERNEEIHNQKEAIEMQATALLKLNEELQELNKTLEHRIEERSSQLLLQNQKLTEYTFVNAHKLRAPVASILGLINLMQQVTPEERETIVTLMKTCGEQLDNIIREISRNLETAIIKEKPR